MDFYSVCVNPCWVKLCHDKLKGSEVKVCSVVGFPLGATTITSKVFEAKEAVNNGASEIDYVINIDSLLEGNLEYLKREALELREALNGIVIKAIIETAFLSQNNIEAASILLDEVGIDFVKTSTGFFL